MIKPVGFLCQQSNVDLIERVGIHLGFEMNVGRNLQEFTCVLACHVRDAAQLPFSPEDRVVVELGHAVQMNRIDSYDSALVD